MRRPAAVLVVLALSACAAQEPKGQDARGAHLKAIATPVLRALIQYRKDHREYPRSLFELTPRYVSTIPFEPGLQWHRDEGVLLFEYEDGMFSETVCLARAGDVEWVCR